MVVGYAMDDNYKTPLIVEALTRAADSATLVSDAIFHSDRGSNYCSREFAAAIAEVGMRQSVGRTGISLLTGQYRCFPCSATRREMAVAA